MKMRLSSGVWIPSGRRLHAVGVSVFCGLFAGAGGNGTRKETDRFCVDIERYGQGLDAPEKSNILRTASKMEQSAG